VLRVNEKHIREYYVPNILGLIITTNHKTDGLYLPEDDRRHYFAWSDRQEEDFTREYWNELWNYYAKGGIEHVPAYLTGLDISDFDPKAPPPKTAAFWQVVSAGHAPEDAEVADAIDVLGNPDALTVKQLTEKATGSFVDWLLERKNRRAFPYRFERCGYVSVRNPDAKDGLWKLKGERQVIYAKASLTPAEAIEAGRKLVRYKG
jgi:hypothetical protein